MLRCTGQGRLSWALAGGALGVLLAGASWHLSGVGRTPEWLTRINQDIPLMPDSPGVTVNAASHAAQQRVINDLLRRHLWSTEEVAELAAILRNGYPTRASLGRRLTPEEFGVVMLHSAASVALLARLECGAPVEPDARREIVHAFIEELEADNPERRGNAALALIVTRSIEDPAVRALVDRLLEDSDADTSETVALQLAHYDDQRAQHLASAAQPEP